jgi:hypothetical protein
MVAQMSQEEMEIDNLKDTQELEEEKKLLNQEQVENILGEMTKLIIKKMLKDITPNTEPDITVDITITETTTKMTKIIVNYNF